MAEWNIVPAGRPLPARLYQFACHLYFILRRRNSTQHGCPPHTKWEEGRMRAKQRQYVHCFVILLFFVSVCVWVYTSASHDRIGLSFCHSLPLAAATQLKQFPSISNVVSMIWENVLNSNQRRARQSTSNDDEKTKNAWKYQYYSQLTQLISNASAPNSQEIILGVSTMMHVFFFLRYVSVGRATMHCVRNDACRVPLAVTSSTATAMAKWEVEEGEIQQQQNRSRSSIFVISSDILIRIKLIENENYGLSRVEHITTATDCNTQHYDEVKKKYKIKHDTKLIKYEMFNSIMHCRFV